MLARIVLISIILLSCYQLARVLDKRDPALRHAPPDQARAVHDPDPWQKLKQEVARRRQFAADRTEVNTHSERQASTTLQSEPMISQEHEPLHELPVQESADEGRPAPQASGAEARTVAPQKEPSHETAPTPRRQQAKEPAHKSGGTRVVRITTYRGGKQVRVRSFTIPLASAPSGQRYRRFALPCPEGRCQQLDAGMFKPGGAYW